MNLKLIGFLLSLLFSMQAFAQESFYKGDEIREVKLRFYQTNWDALLDSLYIKGHKERILADVFIDGIKYDSVGVRYKGYSSASINRVKNPFNIKLNYRIKGQKHLGIDKLKLSNVIQDPSFVREFLSYEIARKYMPASEANFANLYINDTLIGLYTNVEAVNNEFLNKHFSSSSNVLVKGNPEEVDLYGENSNLSNTPGIDSSSYFSLYTMKSVYGWGDFYGMIDTLNNFKHAISDVLNVDRVLWMHALNYTLVNFDSYIGYAQNYYMYQDDHGRFNPILWDLNMSFGSFRLADASSYYDGFTISQAKIIDPLSHYFDYSVYPRPLLRNLFEYSRYRKMYLAHIRTIIEENFLDADFVTRGEALAEFIENSVLADTNKFYSNADFQNNLYTTVTDLVEYPGLVDLMEGRTAYLSSYHGYQGAPSIDSISYNPQVPATGDTLTITSKINNATEVLLSFRYGDKSLFETVSMNDSGLNGDEFPLDGMYTAQVVYHGADLAYYIFAENDSSGVFSPPRAAYEFYTIAGAFTKGDLVINELMASNKTSQSDDENEFDDWVELYNTSETPIALLGLFLSDDLSDLNKWALPDMFIQPDDYLIVWADSETSQSGVHSNFKLNATGEQLFLSDAGSTILDSLTFSQQLDDVSYARKPNGTGSFTFLSATFNTSNDSATIIPKKASLVLDVHPNPVNETLFITIESQAKSMLSFYDAVGRLLYSKLFTAGIIQTTISTKGLKPGVYFSVLRSNDSLATKKVIKF